ncbi:copper homeostasis protein CutC [Paenibacillus eucommiae]|uniref:PF03932 family protein CutC n=1 Tax=Paenibacillus eucommiae TaxID=1355755 RepID=A0ABS4IWL8_9BACL|nr:copper homeostasis protein CutC [Paenibacillus eucommiae]MBP1991987.1 copper homeostasis protein [Paenibacillus eucommiae]
MILEVIATSVLDAKLAQEYGVNRIELISGIMEGGVTPSYGLIEQVVRAVDIPVNVMLRPHANSFCYDLDDLEVMVRDIRMIRELGAAGTVMGMLNLDKQIDIPALEMLLSEAGNMAVTFHRAFDELEDQQAALQTLAKYPAVHRVLTSGGKSNVLHAKQEIAELVKTSGDLPIEILAGSGLSVEKLDDFIRQTAVHEVHMGTGVRVNNQALQPVDPKKLQAAVSILSHFK